MEFTAKQRNPQAPLPRATFLGPHRSAPHVTPSPSIQRVLNKHRQHMSGATTRGLGASNLFPMAGSGCWVGAPRSQQDTPVPSRLGPHLQAQGGRSWPLKGQTWPGINQGPSPSAPSRSVPPSSPQLQEDAQRRRGMQEPCSPGAQGGKSSDPARESTPGRRQHPHPARTVSSAPDRRTGCRLHSCRATGPGPHPEAFSTGWLGDTSHDSGGLNHSQPTTCPGVCLKLIRMY